MGVVIGAIEKPVGAGGVAYEFIAYDGRELWAWPSSGGHIAGGAPSH